MEVGRLLGSKIVYLLHPLPILNFVFSVVPDGPSKPGIYQREMLLHTNLAGYRGFRKWERAGQMLGIHVLQTVTW